MQLLVIAILMALASVGALIARRHAYQLQNVPVQVCYAGLALAVVLLLASCVTIVPAGHVGVKVLLGKVQPGYLGEGFHLINPILDVEHMSVRAQAYTMSGTVQEGDIKRDDSIMVLSKDGLELALDITVNYKLLADDAAWVFQKLGPDYMETIIRPAVRTAIREAASEFQSAEAYADKRKELAEKAEGYLRERLTKILRKTDEGKSGLSLAGDAFVIQQLLLRNVELPERQRRAIENKLAEQQEALRMQFVIDRETKEKERKKIEAEGIALRMETIKKQLTPEFLRFKGIEATMQLAESNNTKVIVIGSGQDGLPLILNAEK